MKKILIILSILVFILLVLSWFNSRQQTSIEGVLQISGPENGVHTYCNFPTKDLQSITTAKGDFQALAVSSLLERCHISDEWQQLTFHSSDGAQVRISRTELPLLYLSQISKNDETYLRLIIPSDNFSQRWLKKITRIELQ